MAVNFNEITLSDQHLFETMLLQDMGVRKRLIGKLIGIPTIADIVYIHAEDSQKPSFTSKGVRFDVYIKDQEGVAYIVELQRNDTKELVQRARYYQAVCDSKQLVPGDDYRDLKDNYAIFICREDIFKQDLYKYSFKNTCTEVENLDLKDGTHKIFFNTKGSKGDICEDVIALLKRIEGLPVENEFVQEIDRITETIKENEEWRQNYMQTFWRERDAVRRGFAQGLEQGLEQGLAKVEAEKLEIAKKLLKLETSIENIAIAVELTTEEINALVRL